MENAMKSSHTFNYPVQITTENKEYFVQSIDYKKCSSKSKDLTKTIGLVRDQLEEVTWKDSQKNKLIEPSLLTEIKTTNQDSFITEIEIVKRYNSLPKTLYYYLEFSEIAIKMLSSPYIWFSNPKSFNDPFELPEVFEFIWSGEEEWQDFKFAYDSHKNGMDILKGFKDANDAYLNLKFKNQTALTEILKLKIKALDQTIHKRRVSCFSRHYDNILMWSHYASKHSGIVIGYDYNKLIRNLPNVVGSDVDYRQHLKKLRIGDYAGDFKSIFKSDYIDRKIFNKHPSWAYEQEFRLISSSMDDGKLPIDRDCISELYFGCNIDKDIQETLSGIVEGQDIGLYCMKKTADTKLIRTEYKKTR